MSTLDSLMRDLDNLDWLEDTLIAKARRRRPSILTDRGLVNAILKEARSLRQEIGGSIDSHKPALRASINIDWRGASDRERRTAVNEVAKLMKGLPSKVLPGLKAVLNREGTEVLRFTHEDTHTRHPKLKLNPSFSKDNGDAVKALSETSSIFFNEEYEERADRMRERAQKVITKGLDKGFGRREIAEELEGEFDDLAVANGYWETVAAVHTVRARSFASVKTYAESDVERFQVVAILDSRTTEVCQFMDGKILSVSKALKAFEKMEDADSLSQMKRRYAPFMHTDGESIFLPGDRKVATMGDDGDFDQHVDDLQAAGIHTPPYHYNCRSTIVPLLD